MQRYLFFSPVLSSPCLEYYISIHVLCALPHSRKWSSSRWAFIIYMTCPIFGGAEEAASVSASTHPHCFLPNVSCGHGVVDVRVICELLLRPGTEHSLFHCHFKCCLVRLRYLLNLVLELSNKLNYSCKRTGQSLHWSFLRGNFPFWLLLIQFFWIGFFSFFFTLSL